MLHEQNACKTVAGIARLRAMPVSPAEGTRASMRYKDGCRMATVIDEETELEVRNDAKTRQCLMCNQSFQSEWAGERVCRKCKSTETWRRG